MPAEKAKEVLKEKNDLCILDVRTSQEFEKGHLENAINLDFYDADFPEQIAQLSHDKAYLIYCHSGGRALKAGELMEELGFTEIVVVKGDIIES